MQAALLRIFDKKMAVFRMRLVAGWGSDGALDAHLECASVQCLLPSCADIRTRCKYLAAGTFDELGDPDDDDADDADLDGGGDDDMATLQLP